MAAGCKCGGLAAMGRIGPAAGPATSRRFLLGPIRPMPATRSTLATLWPGGKFTLNDSKCYHIVRAQAKQSKGDKNHADTGKNIGFTGT